jgi:hypothetical protein
MAMPTYGKDKAPIEVSTRMVTLTGHPVEVFRVDAKYIYGIIDFKDDAPELHRWWLSGVSPEAVDWSLRGSPKFTTKSNVMTTRGEPIVLWQELSGCLYGIYYRHGEWIPQRWDKTTGESIWAGESEELDLLEATKECQTTA